MPVRLRNNFQKNGPAGLLSEKLGVAAEDLKDVPDGRGMTDLIRAKTMKKVVWGMCNRTRDLFLMAGMNQFVLKCGLLTLTWLMDLRMESRHLELREVGKSTGVVAFVIPDRNYTPGSPIKT